MQGGYWLFDRARPDGFWAMLLIERLVRLAPMKNKDSMMFC
jgi:hypothetical protein